MTYANSHGVGAPLSLSGLFKYHGQRFHFSSPSGVAALRKHSHPSTYAHRHALIITSVIPGLPTRHHKHHHHHYRQPPPSPPHLHTHHTLPRPHLTPLHLSHSYYYLSLSSSSCSSPLPSPLSSPPPPPHQRGGVSVPRMHRGKC